MHAFNTAFLSAEVCITERKLSAVLFCAWFLSNAVVAIRREKANLYFILKTENIFHAKDTFFAVNKFSSKNGACSKPFAIMCSVNDLYVVNSRFIFYFMCTGRRVGTVTDDLQFLCIIAYMIYPNFFCFDLPKHL